MPGCGTQLCSHAGVCVWHRATRTDRGLSTACLTTHHLGLSRSKSPVQGVVHGYVVTPGCVWHRATRTDRGLSTACLTTHHLGLSRSRSCQGVVHGYVVTPGCVWHRATRTDRGLSTACLTTHHLGLGRVLRRRPASSEAGPVDAASVYAECEPRQRSPPD